ncbi:hypothetical protein SAMN05444858_102101 [Micromonospora avicenniae]|uniref:Uncharacterized protein n=2 Tax=Micromonospora avicenniae TaxID=1198245 RepID=A0A1N6S5D3_9ACTN|nr:hypothetical protein SAMN05444858_102101 [Micromonospora avicenniae]
MVPSLLRDPARALIAVGDRTGGELVRINLGSFRPYLVTHPRHVRHVPCERSESYERADDGLSWRPVERLFGEGQIGSASRKMLQPMFTAKRIEALLDGMAEAIRESVDELDKPSRDGRTVDIEVEQTRTMNAYVGVIDSIFDVFDALGGLDDRQITQETGAHRPELRDDPAATGADEDEEMVRQPEQVRRMMSSYQKGTRRGRTEAARLLGDDDAPEAGPGPEADEQQAT